MKTISQAIKAGALAACTMGLMDWQASAAPGYLWQHDLGTIQHIEPQAGIFTLLDKRQALVAIRWNHHTRFVEHGKPALSTDLKPGGWVSVACKKQGDQMIAKTVRLLPQHPQAANRERKHS